jgi:23S rRNA pseudouridine1911/1915/1917 synthase
MSHIGSPLVGDELYRGDMSEMSRQALHCAETLFTQPMSQQTVKVLSPLPNDMMTLLEKHFGETAVRNILKICGFELEE